MFGVKDRSAAVTAIVPRTSLAAALVAVPAGAAGPWAWGAYVHVAALLAAGVQPARIAITATIAIEEILNRSICPASAGARAGALLERGPRSDTHPDRARAADVESRGPGRREEVP